MKKRISRRPDMKIAAIGGGTGLSTMLRGLKKYTDRLMLCMKMRMSCLLISLSVCCHKRLIKMTAL